MVYNESNHNSPIENCLVEQESNESNNSLVTNSLVTNSLLDNVSVEQESNDSSHSSVEAFTKTFKKSSPSPIKKSISAGKKRLSITENNQTFSNIKSNSACTLVRLVKLNNLIYVDLNDNSGLLVCDGYGSKWPYKIAFEFDTPEITNPKTFGGIVMTCECIDQGWGGTGHNNVRYQVGSNKIIPAFFIDYNKNPSSKYSYTIKPEEIDIETKTHITVWLCSAPWSGWSATMKSAAVDIKYI